MAFRGRGKGSGLLTADNYYSGYSEMGLGAVSTEEKIEAYRKDMQKWEGEKFFLEQQYKNGNLTDSQFRTQMQVHMMKRPEVPKIEDTFGIDDLTKIVATVGETASSMYTAHADYQMQREVMKERNESGGPMPYTPTYMQEQYKQISSEEAKKWAIPLAAVAAVGLIVGFAFFRG